MLHIRNGVYTHPETGDAAKKKREGKRERRSISRTECNERDVSEREGKRGILGKVRRGIWGKRGFRGERKGRTEDSEAGSRSMEVTWPAKPSGLSNFRLDTSRGLAATSLARVARTPLVCPILYLSETLPLSPRFRLFFFSG